MMGLEAALQLLVVVESHSVPLMIPMPVMMRILLQLIQHELLLSDDLSFDGHDCCVMMNGDSDDGMSGDDVQMIRGLNLHSFFCSLPMDIVSQLIETQYPEIKLS